MKKKQGVFITFEGIDGSGKTTVIQEVYNKLNEMIEFKDRIILTREPGGTELSEKIRNVILDNNSSNIDPMTELLLFLAARRQHLKDIVVPAIKEGKIILCDRYIDSSFIYQGMAKGISLEKIEQLSKIMVRGDIPIFPTSTIIFNIEPKTALSRIQNRTDNNRLDSKSLEELQRLTGQYNKIVKKYSSVRRFDLINANNDLSEVIEECMETIIDIIHEKQDINNQLINKYNLKFSDLNNFKLVNKELLIKKMKANRNSVTNTYMIAREIGSNEDKKYGDTNEFFIHFYDDNSIKVDVYAYGGMTSYNFENFLDVNEIENENDRRTHIELLKIFNKMIDLNIIKKI